MAYKKSDIDPYLQDYLETRLRENQINPASADLSINSASSDLEAPKDDNSNLYSENLSDSNKRINHLNHQIYRIKDKLKYHIYGPRTEALADSFIQKYNLQVKRHSLDYYAIMRDVLKTEMQLYTILLQQEAKNANQNHD